jgi:hypothetical protein
VMRLRRNRQIRKLIECVDYDPDADTLFLCSDAPLGRDEAARLCRIVQSIIDGDERPRLGVLDSGLRIMVIRGKRSHDGKT